MIPYKVDKSSIRGGEGGSIDFVEECYRKFHVDKDEKIKVTDESGNVKAVPITDIFPWVK